MKHWTIGQRITFGFSAVLFITLAIGAFAYSRTLVIQRHSDSLATDSLPGVGIMTRIQSDVRERYAFAEKMLLTPDLAGRRTIVARDRAVGQRITELYRQYEATIHHAEDRALYDSAIQARAAYIKVIDGVTGLCLEETNAEALKLFTESADPVFEKYDALLQKLVDYNRTTGLATGNAIVKEISATNRFILFGVGAALLVGALIAYAIMRGVNRSLRTAGDTLASGASQVASAANQVSASSQSLAEGSSEQAASLEETSASLEEVSSMSKRNAENARQARDLASQTRLAAETGETEMLEMKRAMDEIKGSSNDISKIIKTIDEIAFQTNILALNAAVEAARAGDAGQGFAVVADEVRNLAQRSAQSAKETAAQIEVAISRSDRGVSISAKVAQSLSQIVEKTRRVDTLVAEIATASDEQTQGVGQVNSAVGQMDKVTQANAGTAEETAAAAEELNAQSAVMREAVGGLMNLIERRRPPAASPKTAGEIALPASAHGKPNGGRWIGRAIEGRTLVTARHPHRNAAPVARANGATENLHFQDC
ncbi:MAG TPA: methyl-accepting chemotaxis protein [Opitutaceae bacterium]|nr:methyl-accepting chemotaxis protein [Opitutaceae bacterium]